VLVEFHRATLVICDRALFRELVRQAIARTVQELEDATAARVLERAATEAARARSARRTTSSRPSTAPRRASSPSARTEW
jgi:hypothetical protein